IPSTFIKRISCGCLTGINAQLKLIDAKQLFQRLLSNHAIETLMVKNIYDMGSASSLEELMNSFSSEMKSLSISHCYIALKDDGYQDTNPIPNTFKSVLVYENFERKSELENLKIDALKLAPPNTQVTMVLEPLFSKEEIYGYIFYQISINFGWYYDTIHKQLCSALKFVILNERMNKLIEQVKGHSL
ncbi:MAG: hypothetical protein H7X94_15285, partial [Vallitaleaceae bacterium]|nr:hypothetical protein [Vallitaleaceae bacterium]